MAFIVTPPPSGALPLELVVTVCGETAVETFSERLAKVLAAQPPV